MLEWLSGMPLSVIFEVLHHASAWDIALFPTVHVSTAALKAHWPLAGIDAVNTFELPLLNEIILLSSGVAVTYAHHSILQGNRNRISF